LHLLNIGPGVGKSCPHRVHVGLQGGQIGAQAALITFENSTCCG
jgi:hypothetical protein